MLSLLAIVSGVLWPDWLGAAWLRMLNIVDETRARGRGEGRMGLLLHLR